MSIQLAQYDYLNLATNEVSTLPVTQRHPSVSRMEVSSIVHRNEVVTAQATNTAISATREADLSIVTRSISFMAKAQSMVDAMVTPIDEAYTGFSEGIRTRIIITHAPELTQRQDKLGNFTYRNRFFIVSEVTTTEGKKMSLIGDTFTYTKSDAIAHLRTLKVLNDSFICHDVRDNGGYDRTKAQRQSIDKSYVISRVVIVNEQEVVTYFDGDKKAPAWVTDIRLAKRYTLEQAYRTSKVSGGSHEMIA